MISEEDERRNPSRPVRYFTQPEVIAMVAEQERKEMLEWIEQGQSLLQHFRAHVEHGNVPRIMKAMLLSLVARLEQMLSVEAEKA